MASQFVQVSPDSTGKKVQTFENTVSGNVVEAQAVALVDSTGIPLIASTSSPFGNENGLVVRTVGINTVGGEAAAGIAPVGNPLLTAGTDGTTVRTIKTTSAGTTLIQVENSSKATYIMSVASIADTSSTAVFSIEAGASKTVRLRQLVILNPGSQGTAGLRLLTLIRTTTAGSGGTTITPPPMEPSFDAAFSGLCRSGGTLGTSGGIILTIPLFVPAAVAAFNPIVINFAIEASKCPVIAAGTINGISLRDPGATTAANLAAYLIFTEE